MRRIVASLESNRAEGADACVLVFRIPLLDPVPTVGQFFMVKLLAPGFPLFGRALAVLDYEAGSTHGMISFLAKEVGRGTAMMRSAVPGAEALLLGPAGQGFPRPSKNQPLVMVAGGTGIAAFHYLLNSPSGAKETKVLLYGARNSDSLYLHDDLRTRPLRMKIATEDGSAGLKGLVTDLLAAELDQKAVQPMIFACGPDPMMKAVTHLCGKRGLSPYLSLETRMACGIGVCNGCAVEVVRDGHRAFERACHEGPVFPAHLLPMFADDGKG